MGKEEMSTTREHSSPLDSNCHQQEVFRDVNMWGEKSERENTALVILALLHALITSYFLSINTRFDGLI